MKKEIESGEITAISKSVDYRIGIRLGRAYARRVLHVWENVYPDNFSPHECLATIDRFLAGEATIEELQEVSNDSWIVFEDRNFTNKAMCAAMSIFRAAWNMADAARWAVRAADDPGAERSWQLAETRRILDEYAD